MGQVTALDTRRARADRDPFTVDRGELRSTIAEWQAEVYPEASEDDGGGGLAVIVLRRSGARRDAQLLLCPVREDSTAETLAHRIATVAERYADSTAPGFLVALEVCAFYGKEALPRVIHHIGIRGQEGEDEQGGASGMPGGKATDIVRFMQVHAAGTLHAAEQKDRRATNLVMDALDGAYKRIKDLESQVVQLFDANMRLADNATEREAKVIVAKASAEIRREAGKLAMGLAPTVVNRLAGRQIMPEGLHPMLATLSQLTMDISEDEALAESIFGALMKHGTKGQRLARQIGELMASVASVNAAADQAKRIGEEAAAAATPQMAPSPLGRLA